jgi:opacity protein-like surface antigen
MRYRKFFFTFLLLIVVVNSKAQVYTTNTSVKFYFTIGFNGANLFRDTVRYETGYLYQGGMGTTFALTEQSRIGLEVQYARKRIKISDPAVIKFNFDYIDLPLFYQYNFNKDFRLNLGLQYSYLLSSTYTFLDGSKSKGVNSKPLNSAISNNLALMLGTEFSLYKNLFIGFRYSLSTDYFIEKSRPSFSVFQFSLNFIFYKNYKQLFGSKEVKS